MDSIDADIGYEAVKAHDPRFDGRIFVGVTSTRIYCRPICRVRTPRRENCRFFETAAQAEAAAFRPCMKCRPEIAPGPGLAWTAMDASRTLARQAAHALDAHAADGDATSLAELAERIGVSDRHLRRIFAAEHGVTPIQYLHTRRLLLAKQLLTDTTLPVAQVALASGFRSLRRFNTAFAESYRMSPTRLRGEVPGRPAAKGVGAPVETGRIDVTLAYRAPYDVAALLRFVERRAIPGIEAVDGARIRRSLRVGTVAPVAGWIEAEFVPDASRVRLGFAAGLAPYSGRVLAAVRRWLDLDAAPQTIDTALAGLPGEPGLRLPGSLDGFELAVRAVLGQQVTVAAARTLARRLVERFGEAVATPWDDVARCFPSPEALAELPVERIAELGIIRSRATAILGLAQGWPEIAPLLKAHAGPEALIDRLRGIAGIGPWTAHYIAMRALSWPDAFPPNDVAVLKATGRLFDQASQREADVLAQAWRPWRSYAVLRLWNSLETTP
jgi:AraC family transcriptional regulator of adaptative response / DNA-3-methyladenine glycosylase II